MKDSSRNQIIVERNRQYKQLHNSDVGESTKRACVKVHQTIDEETKVLYVGSVGKQFHGRVRQHLGFAGKGTYALQLVHWGTKLDLRLSLHWVEFDEDRLRYYVEDALASKMHPLVGKRGAN